jgi:hypothetical protein
MRTKTFWALLVALMLATLTTCDGSPTVTPPPSPTATISPAPPTPSGIPLTFVTVDQEDSSHWSWREREPHLFLAGDESELSAFIGYVREDVRGNLQSTDWDSHFILAAFPGVQPTHGYHVSIRDIRALPDTISVEAITTGPAGEALPQEAIPYHIVRVDRDAAHLGPGTTVVLILNRVPVQSFSLN